MGVWDDLEERIDVVIFEGVEVRRPQPEDLDRYEAGSGFRLPDDYREFALTFGPGEVGDWSFLTPGFKERGKDVDIGEANLWWKEYVIGNADDERLASSFHDAARARRLVLFCSLMVAGDQFAWDPGDVTDADRPEYGIYIIASEANNPPVERVATTFRGFVLEYALGGGYERHIYRGKQDVPGVWNSDRPIAFSQVWIPEDEG